MPHNSDRNPHAFRREEVQKSFADYWIEHFDTLDEEAKPVFLLKLKREWREEGNHDAMDAFLQLCSKWMSEPIPK